MKKLGIILLIMMLMVGCKGNAKNDKNIGLGTGKLTCSSKDTGFDIEQILEYNGEKIVSLVQNIKMETSPSIADVMLETFKESYNEQQEEGVTIDVSLNSSKTEIVIKLTYDVNTFSSGSLNGFNDGLSGNLSINYYRSIMEENGFTCK